MPDDSNPPSRKLRRGRRPNPPPPPRWPDVDYLAQRHLGAPDAAAEMRLALQHVANLAAHEHLRLPPSKLKEKLTRASKAAKKFAQAIESLGPGLWLSALVEADMWAASLAIDPAKSEPMRAGQALARSVEDFRESERMLRYLATAFGEEADRIEGWKRGGVSRPGSLRGGLVWLLEIWRDRRPNDPPGQGEVAGTFGALATDLFAGPPCNFGVGTVRHAVAELLPRASTERQVSRPASASDVPCDRRVHVRLIGAQTGLARAICRLFETAEGRAPQCDHWDAPAATTEQAAGDDLIVLVPDIDALLTPAEGERVSLMDNETIFRDLLHRPVRVLDSLEGQDKPNQLVVLLPYTTGVACQKDGRWTVVRDACYALASQFHARARQLGWEKTTLLAIECGWGEGLLPASLLTEDQVAVVLIAALKSLGIEQSGRTLNLLECLSLGLPSVEGRGPADRAASAD
jgi:hypothetical protein